MKILRRDQVRSSRTCVQLVCDNCPLLTSFRKSTRILSSAIYYRASCQRAKHCRRDRHNKQRSRLKGGETTCDCNFSSPDLHIYQETLIYCTILPPKASNRSPYYQRNVIPASSLKQQQTPLLNFPLSPRQGASNGHDASRQIIQG